MGEKRKRETDNIDTIDGYGLYLAKSRNKRMHTINGNGDDTTSQELDKKNRNSGGGSGVVDADDVQKRENKQIDAGSGKNDAIRSDLVAGAIDLIHDQTRPNSTEDKDGEKRKEDSCYWLLLSSLHNQIYCPDKISSWNAIQSWAEIVDHRVNVHWNNTVSWSTTMQLGSGTHF